MSTHDDKPEIAGAPITDSHHLALQWAIIILTWVVIAALLIILENYRQSLADTLSQLGQAQTKLQAVTAERDDLQKRVIQLEEGSANCIVVPDPKCPKAPGGCIVVPHSKPDKAPGVQFEPWPVPEYSARNFAPVADRDREWVITFPQNFYAEAPVHVLAKDRLWAITRLGLTVWSKEEWQECVAQKICQEFGRGN